MGQFSPLFSPHSLWLCCDAGVDAEYIRHLFCRCGLRMRVQMGIEICGRGIVAVSQPLLYILHVDSVL